jgi:hypothetical protein
MSFGYSVDFVAVSQLVADLIGSLRETGGSKSDYQEIILELEQLGSAIRLLDDLTEDSSIEVYGLKCAAASCRSILEEFHNKIKKYETSLGQNSSAGMVHKTWKKMLWLKERDYIDKVRTYLSMHQRTIQTMLIEYNLAGTKMIQENQNAIGEAVEATNERITDAAKNIERQGVLISASSVLLRHLYQLLNGDIKASLMEVTKYAKTTL